MKAADRAQRLLDDLAFASRVDSLVLLEREIEEAEEDARREERERCAIAAHLHGNYVVAEAIRRGS